jgi:hypothetical protein
MRSIGRPFVVTPPAGARIRTRLRLSEADEAVLRAVGDHLGRLASADLAWRCRLGQQDDLRTIRKRAFTGQSSSRWAGAITRTSGDQWQRALANLADRRIMLRRAIRTIRSRLAVPVGSKQDRVRGYATRTERFAKRWRLQHLEAELVEVEDRLAGRRMSVCRGGRRLAKQRHTLDQAKVSEQQWRARWQAERMFLTADGETAKPWGNETIRVHPDQHWLELRLPNPLAHLSNTPGRAATGCRSLVVENLDFAITRHTGRETLGRGRHGKRFRRTVAGLPTRRFRNLLVGMAANHQLWVLAVDPSWTSKWGQRHWLAPLARSTKSCVTVTRHHAAAVVIARRGLGVGARRRPGVPGNDQRIVAGELPTRPSRQRPGPQGPGPPGGQRAAAVPRRTRSAERSRLGDQVVQDRSGPPGQDTVLHTCQER